MVAVRSAHLNQDEQFELDKWISSLGQDPKVAKRLKEVYLQGEAILQDNDQGQLLLWRGREMIEILITLSMDKATLVAALLFPLVSSGAYSREQFEEDFGKETIKLIDGVEEMAALGQLNVTLEAVQPLLRSTTYVACYLRWWMISAASLSNLPSASAT